MSNCISLGPTIFFKFMNPHINDLLRHDFSVLRIELPATLFRDDQTLLWRIFRSDQGLFGSSTGSARKLICHVVGRRRADSILQRHYQLILYTTHVPCFNEQVLHEHFLLKLVKESDGRIDIP